MSLPRDDLDLIDALVWARCITRETGHRVAEQAVRGRVATYIRDCEIYSVHACAQLIVGLIARSEPVSDEEMWAFRREFGLDQPETD